MKGGSDISQRFGGSNVRGRQLDNYVPEVNDVLWSPSIGKMKPDLIHPSAFIQR